MNRNRNRNASPAAKSEIGCRCSQTHSRSTHTLTHLRTRGGRAGRDYGRLFDDGAHAHWTIAHEGAISQPNQHGHKSRFAALLTLPFAVDVTFEHRPRRLPSPISHSPSTHIANRPHRQQHPQIHSHTPPHHPFLTASLLTQANLRCDPLSRSLSSKQHPSTRTRHWPPLLRKDEMQHASLFANAARRTPHAICSCPRHATLRRRRSLSRDFERERRTRQGRRNAAHCIPCKDRPSCKVNPTSHVHHLRPPTREKVRVRVVSPIRPVLCVSPS